MRFENTFVLSSREKIRKSACSEKDDNFWGGYRGVRGPVRRRNGVSFYLVNAIFVTYLGVPMIDGLKSKTSIFGGEEQEIIWYVFTGKGC